MIRPGYWMIALILSKYRIIYLVFLGMLCFREALQKESFLFKVLKYLDMIPTLLNMYRIPTLQLHIHCYNHISIVTVHSQVTFHIHLLLDMFHKAPALQHLSIRKWQWQLHHFGWKQHWHHGSNWHHDHRGKWNVHSQHWLRNQRLVQAEGGRKAGGGHRKSSIYFVEGAKDMKQPDPTIMRGAPQNMKQLESDHVFTQIPKSLHWFYWRRPY